MVVEDDKSYSEAINERLTAWGYNSMPFYEGLKALDYLQTSKPDIMFLDLGLKDVSGMKVLKDTKAKYPDLPIWIITAFTDDDIQEQAKSLGADKYILKPISIQEIKAMLKEKFGVQKK